jgi:hypothetical protein
MVEGAEVDFSRALTYPFACSKNKSICPFKLFFLQLWAT